MSDMSIAVDPRVGSRLAGRYLIEERLERGGMATVYRARDEILGRDVAVKIMHPSLAVDPTFAERFRREAQSAARLSHPNVVTVYDCGESHGESYIVMELVDGSTLRTLLDRFGRLDPPTVRHVARGVAAALDHAHAKGIVHRDMKPENVLVTPDGKVKVVDFGIATALGPQAARLTTDRPIGTIAYVAPEQLHNAEVDGRADVYALGAMCYEMLTGRAPFRGDTPQAVAAARLQQPMLSPGISPEIDGAVTRATSAWPKDRFETPGEFARSLGEGGAPTFLVATDHLPPPPPSLADIVSTATHAQPAKLPPLSDETRVEVLPLQTRLHRRSRRRFRIFIALAMVVAVAGTVAYAISPKAKTVPELRGQTFAEAKAALDREGLEISDVAQVFHDSAIKGTIVDSNPRPGSAVREGTKVRLSISKGPELFSVPDVVGKSVDEAKALMQGAGFTLVVAQEQYDDSVPAGNVISHDPATGQARKGTAFNAIVSKGPPLQAVPNVNGKTESSARSTIEGAGFAFATSNEYSDTVAEGIVVRSAPGGGEMAPKGSQVTAVISKGPRPFPMPDLVGMNLEAAKAKARAVGLVVRNAYPVPGSGKPPGQVQGQNPTAGATVRKGTSVDLYYSQ